MGEKMTAFSRVCLVCGVFVAFWAAPHMGRASDDTPCMGCDVFAAHPDDPERKAAGIAPEKIDVQRALAACRSAVARFPDSPRLHFQLGRVYLRGGNLAGAIAEYRMSADKGYAAAQYQMSNIYGMGLGVERDDAKSAVWCRKAAEQGVTAAQYLLGRMYSNGWGVEQDDAQAAVWYRKAGEQGDVDAQIQLGIMYQRGLGVAKDETQAAQWLHKAAAQGSKAAENLLHDVEEKTNRQ